MIICGGGREGGADGGMRQGVWVMKNSQAGMLAYLFLPLLTGSCVAIVVLVLLTGSTFYRYPKIHTHFL